MEEETEPPTELTAEEEKIFKETFNQLDKERRGVLSLEHIGTALRMNNQCPSEAEIQTIILQYTEEGREGQIPDVDFDDFCTIMKENWKTKEALTELISEAFGMFDKGDTGMISEEELRNALTTMGEVLEEDEMKELLKDAGMGSDGKVSYVEFTELLLNGYSRPQSKKPKGSAKKGKQGKK